MLLVRNDAVRESPKSFTADGAKVPFDTVVLSTNDNLTLVDDDIQALTPGVYDTVCCVTVDNSGSSAVTVTLSAYANGKAVTGAEAKATVAASGSATIELPWATRVIPAPSGVAKLSWFLSGGAVSMSNALAKVERIV